MCGPPAIRFGQATDMPIFCVDGQVDDEDLALWEAPTLWTRVALERAQVCAVFEGPPLARGIAMLALTPAQFDKLFPEQPRRKNALALRRWAARIRGERARTVLAGASWHQLRAAAAHDDEDAQIAGALAYVMGIGR
jgi:hypothetical protein